VRRKETRLTCCETGQLGLRERREEEKEADSEEEDDAERVGISVYFCKGVYVVEVESVDNGELHFSGEGKPGHG
jgi:hypothetical protein